MPLIKGCNYTNPVNVGLPAAPVQAGAPSLAPIQGDHLFGDVIGTIETALQLIFGGGALWQTRMTKFDSTLAILWQGLANIDFGHGVNPPITQRAGAPEPDEHSHMFGGYSRRLQWHLCEIVCAGFSGGVEQRRIGGATRAWKNNVLSSFDDLIGNLVDSTALAFYIATPNTIRQANPPAVRHAAWSLSVARNFANNNNGPGKNQVIQVLARYESLRSMLEGLLLRFGDAIKTFDPVNDKWN